MGIFSGLATAAPTVGSVKLLPRRAAKSADDLGEEGSYVTRIDAIKTRLSKNPKTKDHAYFIVEVTVLASDVPARPSGVKAGCTVDVTGVLGPSNVKAFFLALLPGLNAHCRDKLAAAGIAEITPAMLEPCPHCGGTGAVPQSNPPVPCPPCGGKGSGAEMFAEWIAGKDNPAQGVEMAVIVRPIWTRDSNRPFNTCVWQSREGADEDEEGGEAAEPAAAAGAA